MDTRDSDVPNTTKAMLEECAVLLPPSQQPSHPFPRKRMIVNVRLSGSGFHGIALPSLPACSYYSYARPIRRIAYKSAYACPRLRGFHLTRYELCGRIGQQPRGYLRQRLLKSRPQSKINNSQMEEWRYNKAPPPQVASRGEAVHPHYAVRFQSGGNHLNPDNQPLYVNAPPKPKRVADGSSPDPGEDESGITAEHDAASSSFYNKVVARPYRPISRVLPQVGGRSQIINNELPRNNVIASSLRSPPSADAASASTASHYECLRTSYTLSHQTSMRHPPRPRSVDFLEQENKIPLHKTMNPNSPKLITLPRRPKSSMSITTPREDGPDSTLWSEESYARKMRESSMYVRSDNDQSSGSTLTPIAQLDKRDDQAYVRLRPEGAQRVVVGDSTEAKSHTARLEFNSTDHSYDQMSCAPHPQYIEDSNGNSPMLPYIGSPKPGYLAISDPTLSPNDRNPAYDKRMAFSPTTDIDREVSVSEPDEEWGLKLDEASVIKKFSYHYIKNDDNNGASSSRQFSQSNHFHNELKNGSQTAGSQTIPARHQSLGKVHDVLDHDGNRMAAHKLEPVGILKNVKSRKKLELEKNSDSCNRKGPWKSSYQTEKYDKRQVFSDTEILLYETSSDVDDKDRKGMMNNKFPNVSSDDDPDDEVASVLAKGHKNDAISSRHHNNNKIHEPVRPLSHSVMGNSMLSPLMSKNFSSSCENIGELPEENYMPMTPRKRTVSASPLKDHDLNLVGNGSVLDGSQPMDECPYVEMNQSGESKRGSLAAPVTSSRQGESNLASKNRKQQYHGTTGDSSGQEPLYMEVNSVDSNNPPYKSKQLANKSDVDGDADDEDVRGDLAGGSALPDILNTTAPSLLHHGSRRSDSSDADDEASKDLDSIDAPRHPRFSLSDTFRPASYYLGGSLGERAIIAMNSDHPDSSDSDLVSPPPIPACSPPLDDLDTSIDSTINNKELCLNNSKDDSHKDAKEDKFRYKGKNYLPMPTNHAEMRSSEEESVKSERTHQFIKRRPLSADILNSLTDFNVLNPSPSLKKHCTPNNDIYDKVMIKNIYENSRPSSNPVLLSSVEDNESYNPYRKNAFNNKNAYFDNTIGSVKKLNNQSYIVHSSKDMDFHAANEVNLSMPNNERKLFDEYNRNDQLGIRPDDVNFDRSSYPVNVSQKDINYYANTSMLNMGNESQNNAPYYYSDLFKADSGNSLNRMQKPDERLPNNGSMRYYADKDNRNTQHTSVPPFYRDPSQYHDVHPQMNSPDSGVATYHMAGPAQEVAAHYDDLRVGPPPSQTAAYSDEVRLDHHRRSRSLEGLLDDKAHKQTFPHPAGQYPPHPMNNRQTIYDDPKFNDAAHSHRSRGPNPVSHDVAWRENHRKANMRQSRSLEELDVKIDEHRPPGSRGVQNQIVYQNSDFSRRNQYASEHGIAADKGMHQRISFMYTIEIKSNPQHRVYRWAAAIDEPSRGEPGKPLVNLVDNMVKLGSLYQSGPQSIPPEKLEFNHKVQEQRLLAEEQKDWERVRADHQDLQKLEETVAENARLEQDLVVLRQKLQLSRRTTEPGGAATMALESELCRVQMLVGNLLRQRQELSAQVRQLTEKSNSLSQQIWPSLTDNTGESHPPRKLVGAAGDGPSSDGTDPTDFVADSPQLSPVYLSETARKIVEEVAWQGRTEKRLIPRERRRHHTVSGLSIIPPKQLFSQVIQTYGLFISVHKLFNFDFKYWGSKVRKCLFFEKVFVLDSIFVRVEFWSE
ncbi:unnamed protein product [Nesidiocoris tenuis]|uniref:Pleckstrin homology domain-containing protein n=1 Tax=Nesidiocoris tenuis TaxID=355587 RepID=A0A6H5HR64_9HEMI|nr:unnamed protein product [Nesidiocoris tenuis]